MFPTFFGIPYIHVGQMISQSLQEAYLRRAKSVLAHTSFLHIHVITTLVLPCTAPAGQALGCHEGMTFKIPSNAQTDRRYNHISLAGQA